ncbi:hypothetical protein BXZ70DRAFT_1285 [Cristinia sonorae]|uniref:Uncharacterized protein n=1 Tax=Cristinia sonorae TaxID=1940300 RepID=A0A8K0V0X0_9AGAR|nr:hypothetical protein BXZ70DRAFT_1285 [Cristinia sonorae]
MKSKLLKSLRFRAKQLLGFKMWSSEPPVSSELPQPDSRSVGSLHLSVPMVGLNDIQYYAQTLLRSLLERDGLGENTFMIHSIYHFRSTRKVEYEFIIVRYTVNDADGDMGPQLLCIEWNLTLLEDLPLAEKPTYEPEVEDTFKRLASLVESASVSQSGPTPSQLGQTYVTHRQNTSSTSLSSGGTSASSPILLAWPVVNRILELPTVDVKCLCMVELGSNRPLSLLRLVWIVAHLRGFQPVYSVLFHQCYWLAASVIEIACEMTGQVPRYFGDSDGWEVMGETVFASAVTDWQGKAIQWSSTPGTVMSLPIMSLKDAMVKNMYDMVVRKWESEVEPQVRFSYVDRRNHLLMCCTISSNMQQRGDVKNVMIGTKPPGNARRNMISSSKLYGGRRQTRRGGRWRGRRGRNRRGRRCRRGRRRSRRGRRGRNRRGKRCRRGRRRCRRERTWSARFERCRSNCGWLQSTHHLPSSGCSIIQSPTSYTHPCLCCCRHTNTRFR